MQHLSPRALERIKDPVRISIAKRRAATLRDGDEDICKICEAASLTAQVRFAYLAVFEGEHRRIIGCPELEGPPSVLEEVICASLFDQDKPEPLIVNDLAYDSRFTDAPQVVSEPRLRFIACFPVFGDGELIGALCVADQTPRKELVPNLEDILQRLAAVAGAIVDAREVEARAEKTAMRLMRSQRRHDLALKAARIATWTWNRKTGEIESDELFRRLLCLDPEGPFLLEDLVETIDSPKKDQLAREILHDLAESKEFSAEIPIAGNDPKTLLIQGRVLDLADESEQGQVIYGVAIDITERRLAEEKRRRLLRELNHRVRNTLAMLQSLAGQTMRRSASAEDFNTAFGGRLQALSNAHHLLTEQEWEAVEVADLLEQQITPLLGQKKNRVTVTGRSAPVGPEESVSLALVIHELMTNALRHGALATRSGRIRIDTDIVALDEKEASRLIRIDWRESGVDGSSLEDSGFGLILIRRSLDKILGATVELNQTSDGIHARIEMPLEARRS